MSSSCMFINMVNMDLFMGEDESGSMTAGIAVCKINKER
jgi:hypothetical protein